MELELDSFLTTLADRTSATVLQALGMKGKDNCDNDSKNKDKDKDKPQQRSEPWKFLKLAGRSLRKHDSEASAASSRSSKGSFIRHAIDAYDKHRKKKKKGQQHDDRRQGRISRSRSRDRDRIAIAGSTGPIRLLVTAVSKTTARW